MLLVVKEGFTEEERRIEPGQEGCLGEMVSGVNQVTPLLRQACHETLGECCDGGDDEEYMWLHGGVVTMVVWLLWGCGYYGGVVTMVV